MARILFATWDGGGNVPPATTIAAELQRRGHDVRFLGHETQRASLTGQGFGFTSYAGAKPFSSLEPNSPARLIALFGDRQMGADVVADLEREPADLVVVDALLLGVLDALQRSGQRFVTLVHLYDGYLRGGWAKGPVGLVNRLRGLHAGRLWDAAELELVATLPSLDPGARGTVPATRSFTGPALAGVPAPHDLARHDPAVLVSLSTYEYPGMTACLQRILDATADLDARVVVTTGPVIDPADLRPSARHEVHRFVPHDELMGQVSLVVGHGGHATTMRALAHDLPLVVMPMHPLLDQPMVGRSVAEAGAGVLLRKKASVEQIRDAVTARLADGPHRAAAARLGAEIREADGTGTAAGLVEGLVSAGQPRR